MACEARLRDGQTFLQRQAEVAAALARVKRYLAAGQVQVVIAPNGAVALKGWTDRADLSDACTVRALTAESSWELRKAIAKAEALGGRRANLQANAAGFHSHDGGKSWDRH